MKKNRYGWIVFLISALLVTFLTVISGNFFTKKVSLQIGEIAKETVYAPFQIENEIATNRLRNIAAASVDPIYKRDSAVQEKAIGNIEKLFESITAIKTSDIAVTLEKTEVEVLSGRSPIGLYNEQYKTLLDASAEDREYLKEECISIASDIFVEGISVEDSNRTSDVKRAVDNTALSVTMRRIAQDIVNNVLAPNVVEDEVATNELKKNQSDKVDPVYILAQEKIIEKGTKVTEEIYNVLDKVGYLDTDGKVQYKQYTGVCILILLMCFLSFKLIKNGYTLQVKNNKQVCLILSLYILAILVTRIMMDISFVYLPLAVPCMIIAFAVGPIIAAFVQIFIIIFATIIFKGDILFVLYFIISSIASILIISRMEERKKTVMNGVYLGVVQFLSFIGLKLFVGTEIGIDIISQSIVALIMGIISVVTVVGALPGFESLFGFVTPMQLLELTNPNQPVLKRLLIEATGTYYHSLLVANLAESAASEINANPLLARVGGYYHDIGKLTCSSYFKENQGVTNPHDYMTPRESYSIISSHVTQGVKLAEEYNLPTYVKDMIWQHHGTSTMQYFYIKEKNSTDEEVLEEDFKYKGPKPKTKEAALIMLADVVEATTRSMQDKLGEIGIESIVRKLVKQKLDEGELDECSLYISDIDKIINSFTKMLTGMYHQRIAYPEKEEEKK